MNKDQNVLSEWSERIKTATAQATPLCIQGSGSKAWYGGSAEASVFDTRSYAGVIAYDPSELVIQLRCGTPLAEVQVLLAAQQQMLAFEPPHFGPGATVGGMVAAGLSGPRRPSVGAVRDFLLGATMMNGRGEILRFGGQVMKNVAGYDVSRVLAGSLGCLGVLLDVSLKVLPQPKREASLVFECGEAQALHYLNRWAGQPLPISASAWHVGRLMLRLSGSEAAVAAAMLTLGGQQVDDATNFWVGVREQTHAYFSQGDDRGLWRLSLPSSAPMLNLSGKSFIEWGGAQRWLYTDENPERVRELAQAAGGHATLFRGGDKSLGVFTPLSAPVAAIHRRLKRAFDPAGIFNPGRLFVE